jgi:hypothetical protein
MKIEELSVGNYVYYTHKEGVYRVEAIHGVYNRIMLLPYHLSNEQATHVDQIQTTSDCISEIPLTETPVNKTRLINNNMQLSEAYYTCIALNECLYSSLHSLQNGYMAALGTQLDVAGCFTESNDAPPHMDIIATLREMLDYFERGGRIV